MSKNRENTYENYLTRKKRENAPANFEDWLKTQTVSDGDLAVRAEEIERDFRTALAGYGRSGERLSRTGTHASGYADALTASAYAAKRQSEDALRREQAALGQKRAAGYAAYLDDYRKSQASKSGTVTGRVASRGIFDVEEAYRYALASGLSDENARAAAEEGVRMAKDARRREIARKIYNGSMNEVQARLYAQSLGFSEEEAEEFANIARRYFGKEVEEIENRFRNFEEKYHD